MTPAVPAAAAGPARPRPAATALLSDTTLDELPVAAFRRVAASHSPVTLSIISASIADSRRRIVPRWDACAAT
jgi:hypothetical protein